MLRKKKGRQCRLQRRKKLNALISKRCPVKFLVFCFVKWEKKKNHKRATRYSNEGSWITRQGEFFCVSCLVVAFLSKPSLMGNTKDSLSLSLALSRSLSGGFPRLWTPETADGDRPGRFGHPTKRSVRPGTSGEPSSFTRGYRSEHPVERLQRPPAETNPRHAEPEPLREHAAPELPRRCRRSLAARGESNARLLRCCSQPREQRNQGARALHFGSLRDSAASVSWSTSSWSRCRVSTSIG